jgi:hypothetical protein
MFRVLAVLTMMLLCMSCDLTTEVCTAELGLAITPAQKVAVGEGFVIQALGTTCGGKHTFNLDVAWTSADSTIIRVEPQGRVTGLRPGIANAVGTDRSRWGMGNLVVTVEVSAAP